MTTLGFASSVCGVCKTPNAVICVVSTLLRGRDDLDRRPPPLARFNLNYEVQCCSQCGYCAADLERAPGVASGIVSSSRYQEQLNGGECTVLANRFLCAALVCEEAGNSLEAAWMTTRAAWVFDDENDWKGSQRARVLAVARFIRAATEPPAVVKWLRPDAVLLTDLLRRAAQFDSAYVACKDGLAWGQPTLAGVLRHEESLILARDAGAWTFDDVLGGAEDYLVAAGLWSPQLDQRIRGSRL